MARISLIALMRFGWARPSEEESLDGLAEDSNGEQADRIKFKPSAFHPRKMHHATGESGVVRLKYQAVGFDCLYLFKNSGRVRRDNAGAKPEGLRGCKVAPLRFLLPPTAQGSCRKNRGRRNRRRVRHR